MATTAKNIYPESSHEATSDARFTFKIYLSDGEKHHTDYYTRENAQRMRDILNAEGQTFAIMEDNGRGDLNEVRSL